MNLDKKSREFGSSLDARDVVNGTYFRYNRHVTFIEKVGEGLCP